MYYKFIKTLILVWRKYFQVQTSLNNFVNAATSAVFASSTTGKIKMFGQGIWEKLKKKSWVVCHAVCVPFACLLCRL
jgi:hypothetical protein